MIGMIIALCVSACIVWRGITQYRFFEQLRSRSVPVMHRLRGYHPVLSALRVVLLCSGLIALGLAYDGHWATERKIERPVVRKDCIIALDVSQSMRTQEGGASRLMRAKQKITALMARNAADRYALYVFAGDAVLLSPLTADHACVKLFLDDVDDGMIAASTTSLAALLTAVLAHDAQDGLLADRTLIIVSDGEDFSEDLSAVIDQARERQLRVITWGIGTTQGAPIPVFDEQGAPKGHLKSSDGTIVISRREDGALTSLAQATQGKHIVATDDMRDIAEIIEQIIPRESRAQEQRVEKIPSRWMLIIAGLLIACEWILSA